MSTIADQSTVEDVNKLRFELADIINKTPVSLGIIYTVLSMFQTEIMNKMMQIGTETYAAEQAALQAQQPATSNQPLPTETKDELPTR